MDCPLEDLYELFLLSALTEEDEARVRGHADSQCPHCASGLREAALALCAILQLCRPVQQSAKAKARLHQRLRAKEAR